VRKALSFALGLASGLAGLVVLPYVGMGVHEILSPSPEVPVWQSLSFFGLMAILCLSAFLMSFRFFRYATIVKSTTE